jgi:hypothetical protein
MRSYSMALAWELRRRHRWGLAILLTYLTALVVVVALLPTANQPHDWIAKVGIAATTGAIPLSAVYVMMLPVFSFGLQADLIGRESAYPSRMFTLPVRTAVLAFWPMLYGTVSAAVLWLFTALFVLRPCALDVPLVMPALLAAVFLAWTQVVMWMPYPLPGLRVIAAVVLLGGLLIGPQVAMEFAVPDGVIIGVLTPLLPLAYGAAFVALDRARRGEVPDWRGWLASLSRIADVFPRRGAPFSSAARAQVWFEWRRHGVSLPFLVLILLPFALLLLFFADPDMPDVVLMSVGGVLLLPMFLAGIAATTVSKTNPYVRDYYGVPPFTATRPMTSAALIAAKLEMALWSTLAAWALVLIAVPLALTLSGNWPVIVRTFNQWLQIQSPLRVVVTALFVGSGLVVFTWKQLVQNLYVGLTGREWFIKTAVFGVLALFVIAGPIGKWVYDHQEYHAGLRTLLPWTAGFIACLKAGAVLWIVTRVRRRRLLSDRVLLTIGSCWLLLLIGTFSILAWLVPAELVSRTLLALGVVLVLPLARPLAAPLALAWNRHR